MKTQGEIIEPDGASCDSSGSGRDRFPGRAKESGPVEAVTVTRVAARGEAEMSAKEEYEVEDLPPSPVLKIIRRDELSDDERLHISEMERQAYIQEWGVVLELPEVKRDFNRFGSYQESAFNTHDFERSSGGGNRFWYAVDKVAEQVADIADTHSIVRHKDREVAERSKRKFRYLVDSSFRERALGLARSIGRTSNKEKQEEMLEKLEELNRAIKRLNAVWRERAYAD